MFLLIFFRYSYLSFIFYYTVCGVCILVVFKKWFYSVIKNHRTSFFSGFCYRQGNSTQMTAVAMVVWRLGSQGRETSLPPANLPSLPQRSRLGKEGKREDEAMHRDAEDANSPATTTTTAAVEDPPPRPRTQQGRVIPIIMVPSSHVSVSPCFLLGDTHACAA